MRMTLSASRVSGGVGVGVGLRRGGGGGSPRVGAVRSPDGRGVGVAAGLTGVVVAGLGLGAGVVLRGRFWARLPITKVETSNTQTAITPAFLTVPSVNNGPNSSRNPTLIDRIK